MYGTLDLLLAMGIAWALYGALILATRPEKKDKDSWTALAVLICLTLPIIDNLLKPGDDAPLLIQPLIYIARNIYYMTGPMLWLYVRTLLKKQPLPWPSLLLHSLPFLAALAVFPFVREVYGSGPMPPPPGTENMPFRHNPELQISPLRIIRDMGTYLSPVLYGLTALLIIKRHSAGIRDYYSRSSTGITLSWLKLLLIIIVAFHTVILSIFLYSTRSHTIPGFLTASLRSLPSVIFVFFFSFFSRNQQIPRDTRSGFDPEKYKKSALGGSQTEKIYKMLETKMREEKPYLDPDLTLEDLAEKLEVTKHHLSQVINSKTKDKFFNYVNQYRIREIMTAFDETRFPELTIIGVAFECGFRSSSAFYKQFKMTTGVTPRQYIKNNGAG